MAELGHVLETPGILILNDIRIQKTSPTDIELQRDYDELIEQCKNQASNALQQ